MDDAKYRESQVTEMVAAIERAHNIALAIDDALVVDALSRLLIAMNYDE